MNSVKSFVVLWVSLSGRFRTKSYIYRRCAEKFAEHLVLSGLAVDSDVRLVTFKGRKMVKAERSRTAVHSVVQLGGVFRV